MDRHRHHRPGKHLVRAAPAATVGLMRRADRHLPEQSCRAGLLMFDGGEVSLARHEIWALCTAQRCSHTNCSAGSGSPSVFRVRSARDLEKHLGAEGSTKVLVVEKGTLSGPPGHEFFDGTVAPPRPEHRGSIAALGEISVERARRRGGFSLSPTGAARLDTTLASLAVSRHLGDADAVRARARARVEALVALHGEHRALDEFERFVGLAGGKPIPPGLAVESAESALASRDHAERLYRGFERVTSTRASRTRDFVEVVPSKPLALLKPEKGTLVGASLRVTLPTDPARTAHLMARLATRGYGLLDEGVVNAALSGSTASESTRSRLPRTKEELGELSATLQSRVAALVAEGVFASGVDDAPVDDKILSRIASTGVGASRPRLESNRVRVTVPSPSSPESSLTFVLELRNASTLTVDGRRKVVADVVPVTVLSPTLVHDDDRTEPMPRPDLSSSTRFGATPSRPLSSLLRRERAERLAETDEALSGNERRFFANLGVPIPAPSKPAPAPTRRVHPGSRTAR